MNMPTKVDVGVATRDTLAALALGDPNLVDAGLELRAGLRDKSGLDDRTFALVKLAAIMALDAPPTSYLWQVANALAAGATPDDMLGVLMAIAPQIGGPRLTAAAPELMVALGLSLPERAELRDTRCHHSPPPVAAPPGTGIRIAGRIPLTAGRPARRGLTAMPGALHARTFAETRPNRPVRRPRRLSRGVCPTSPRGTSASP